MTVVINNESVTLPDKNMSIAELLAFRNVSTNGTAVAINNRMVKHDLWETTAVQDNDIVTIISAAFGG